MKYLTPLFATVLALFSLVANAQDNSVAPKYGKYNCTASKYSGGFYSYTPRGSFIITKDGKYTYKVLKSPAVEHTPWMQKAISCSKEVISTEEKPRK